MKELGLVIFMCLFLGSCDSPFGDNEEVLQQKIEEQVNQEIYKQNQEMEASKIEAERNNQRERQKAMDLAIEKKEKELRESLLSDQLLKEISTANSGAQKLLEVQSDDSVLITDTKFDLISDDSYQKYVDNRISFSQIEYTPADLVSIKSDYINDIKGNGELRMVAFSQLQKLSQDFYLRFNLPIDVVSTYRSYDYQKGIKDRGCPDNLCSNAGYSEHQTGLAFDLWEATTQETFMSSETNKAYFSWMIDNAYRYGFINTYQNGLEADGYDIEPWHWRYVDVELARLFTEYDMSFREFYEMTVETDL